MAKPFDVEALLDQTFFGLDMQAMLGDVEDFIDFSESNIDWQKCREVRRAELSCDDSQFDDPRVAAQYRDQVLEGVAYRFDVSLTQRVRYAALTSLITTIEWVLISLRNRAAFPVPVKPDGKNEAVHLLEVFDHEAGLQLGPQVQLVETLVQVRNCIVHAAGLLSSYKYGTELRQRMSTCTGIKASNVNFLGESVEIDHGYLQSIIEGIKKWLPNLEKVMLEKGLIRR